MVSALTRGSLGIPSPAILDAAPSPAPVADRLDNPTQLCRWSIHVASAQYEAIPEPVADAQDVFDIQDPRSWAAWPAEDPGQSSPSFAESMQDSIVNNTFSLTPTDGLPITTELISQSVKQDPAQLKVDAWKVAIMAGNVELLGRLVDDKPDQEALNAMHPFHLAASFLDGGKSCCGMIALLCDNFGTHYLINHDRDEFGHTVLDTLMIAILRSHTSVSPEHVSNRFNPPHRFPGEEQDICGRWDPVSPVVGALFRNGYARVPTSWKHPFCHTAAQAICHSLIAILASPAPPPIDAPSGLFARRCNHCGLELKLGPLHALVVVAFYLAHMGRPGETLFGALAVLVCLLSLRADASLTTVMSVEDILGHPESGSCRHEAMDPSSLMQAVPRDIVAQWSTDCQTGWACLLQVLLLAKRDEESDSEDESRGDESDADSDCEIESVYYAHEDWLKLPCGNPKLGLLWATIQVELLTYRRIETGDSWVSGLFSMDALRTWLGGGSSEFLTPLVEKEMIEDHTACGWFSDADDFLCPVAEEVCREYFMNMDDYSRGTFLERPDLAPSRSEWI